MVKKRLSLCLRYWSKCNNKCSFCFEDSSGFQRLRDGEFRNPSVCAIRQNNEVAQSLVDGGKYDFFTFKLMGGELFNVIDKDIISELVQTVRWICGVYKQHHLVNEISENKKRITETLIIASNLMYDDTCSIESCLSELCENDYIAASTMFSFDLDGRFNSKTSLDQYMRNIKLLRERYGGYVKIIPSMVLTRQNMNAISNDVENRELIAFKELYDLGYTFDIQLLLNDTHVSDFSYSYDELSDFVDVLSKKYPRLLDVFKCRSSYRNYATTRKTIQCGEVINEESLYDEKEARSCLLCEKYKQCHHSYSNISYNVTECDAREFLKRCS